MKKSLIAAAGVSAFAAVAMPIAGVFATGSNTFTDTVSVTLAGSCSIISNTAASEGNYTRTLSDNITAGNSITLGDNATTPTMNISCNTTTGTWTLSAIGDGTGSDKTAMVGTGSNTETIATGTATSGATSNWAFKLAGAQGANAASGYSNFAAIPSEATPVISGNASDAKDSAVQVYPTYQVYVSTNQAADTYTGKVKYTLAYSAS